MKKFKILIIEDNTQTKRFLEAMIGEEFEILCAGNGILGVDYARTHLPDVIIMDVILPILSGYDACSLLKKDTRTKQIPIILLAPKSAGTVTPERKINLSNGPDEYLPKPFDYKELISKIKGRLCQPEMTPTQLMHIGQLSLDPDSREVLSEGKRLHLTLTEFDILRLLAERTGNVVSREEILKVVWKDESDATKDRTIDVHIRALRKKIPNLSRSIHSVYGVGYKLEPENAEKALKAA